MRSFPFISLPFALILLRVATALLFVAHAVVRIFNGSIPQFGSFLSDKGFVQGTAWVWAITVFEIGGGLLLAAGCWVKWLSAGFILLLLTGIALIHAPLGWFVGEHGSGGCEYSVALIVSFIVIAAAAQKNTHVQY